MCVLWEFATERFRVELTAELDEDFDLSERDPQQVEYDDANGVEYYDFACRVYLDDAEIAADYLGGSGYSDVREFVTAHRDPDPLNRNCSAMRAAKGANVVICHYFPGMVQQAIHEARQAIGRMQSLPKLRHFAE